MDIMVASRHRLLAGFAVLIFWVSAVTALHSYDTNRTLPPTNASHTFYYVSAPNVRSSLQIVWSCLLTLTICVYQVLHLHVPEQRRGRDPGWWGDVKWLGIWRDLGYALLAALAPEYMLYVSVEDIFAARRSLEALHAGVPGTVSTWTTTHMFYASMGGLVIYRDGKPWPLLPTHLLGAMEGELMDETAPITAQEIMDKSKSDAFTKAVSMLQILYFYIDFFARIGQGLPVSQLELGVASVAFFSLVVYACCWYKPKSVKTPTLVHLTTGGLDHSTAHDRIFGKDSRPVHIASLGSGDSDPEWIWHLALAGGVALGAIHLAAWRFDFPSTVDMWLWRSASLCVLATMILALVAVNWGNTLMGPFLLALYVLARTVLIVEMIRCLFFLSPTAFRTTTWAPSIPHLG